MVHRVKEFGQVHVHCPSIALIGFRRCDSESMVSAHVPSEPEATVREVSVIGPVKYLGCCLLHKTVYDCRDSQIPELAGFVFWSAYSFHRGGPVSSLLNRLCKLAGMVTYPVEQLPNFHSVNPGSPSVGYYSFECFLQIRRLQYRL